MKPTAAEAMHAANLDWHVNKVPACHIGNDGIVREVDGAFALVRDYNRTRGSKPEVRSLCWFVDRNDGGWGDFSLRGGGRLAQARQDLFGVDEGFRTAEGDEAHLGRGDFLGPLLRDRVDARVELGAVRDRRRQHCCAAPTASMTRWPPASRTHRR